jgi:IclR family mhp operon transcriptional activator
MIRSLSRGLDILDVLNRRDSATPAELAEQLEIPRATVYRIVDTLVEKGFVYQHESDQRLRLTPKVGTLSDGFTEEDHMANISRPFISEITEQLVWPVTLGTISGIDLIVRENTDRSSPLAVEQFTIGYRMPILETASGLCILAFMQAEQRDVVLATIKDSPTSKNQTRIERIHLQEHLAKIKRDGYSVRHRPRKISDMTAISVPIVTADGRVRGAVTIRYARTSVQLEEAIENFVPALKRGANGIARRVQLHIDRQLKSLMS